MAHPQQLFRLSTGEYENNPGLVLDACQLTGKKSEDVRLLLTSAGERINKVLRLGINPIQFNSNSVTIGRVAGLLKVCPQLELEVIPKFLTSSSPRWREDFFYLSMLSQHGRLLARERLASDVGCRDDLAALVGRAVVEMFWDNHRRPLRTYHRRRFTDFSIDGEVDAETIAFPGADGFDQEIVTYDRRNCFNASILSAVQILLSEVREPQIRQQLNRVSQILSPQNRTSKAPPRFVPNRSRRWQTLYDLSLDVIKGFGLRFRGGTPNAPGFVLDTWRVWEDVITLGLRLGLGASAVNPQEAHSFATRESFDYKSEIPTKRVFQVFPDVSVYCNSKISFLVDAKYKTRITNLKGRIAEADIYEAIAFSMATGCRQVVLCYPTPAGARGGEQLGAARVFERVRTEEICVSGVEVGVQGISMLGGLSLFAQNLSRDLVTIAHL